MNLLTTPSRPLAALALCVTLAACGGGGDGGCSTCGMLASLPGAPASNTPAAPTDPVVPAVPSDTAPPRYAIGGTLTGLATNTKLVLLDNGGDALTLAANGAFGFAAPVAFNTAYAVTIGTQPFWQKCVVRNGSGTATADVRSVQVDCVEAQVQVSTLAGSSAQGATDGAGAAATFRGPQALCVDDSGNVYAADSANHEIRKITPTGVVTTLAGSTTPGSANGTGATAQFNVPDGVAVDAGGNVYVADFNNLIRKITPTGTVTTLAGSTTAGSADGTGAVAQFNNPGGIAVDAGGNVYVADIDNHAIRKITPAGVVSTLAGSHTRGSTNGSGAAASFDTPLAVAVDPLGNVYVADYGNNMIRKITPAGAVSTLAGSGAAGSADGTGAGAQFRGPFGLAADAIGNVYVADNGNHEIRKITPDGVVTTFAGSTTGGTADGIGAAAQFYGPMDVQLDVDGNLYVIADNAVRKITPAR